MRSQKIDVDTNTFIRFWLVLLGFALLALFLWEAMTGLIIVGISIFLAIAINPLVRKISRKFRLKKHPMLSVSLAYCAVMAVLIVVLAVVGPVVISETAQFVGQIPQTFEHTLGGWDGINAFGQTIGVEDLQSKILAALEQFSNSFVSDIGNTVMTSVSVVANLLTGAVLVLVLTFLFLLEGPTIMEQLWKLASGGKKNSHPVKIARTIVQRMADVIATYVSKQVSVAVLDGVVSALAVFVLALIFGFSPGLALPMGLITMIFYLIPMFGAVISCVLVSLILFFSSPWAGVCFAIFYIVYQQIENNIIAPKIQGNALKLPPVVILVAITIGMYMFGLMGAIVAIPIAGCVRVLIEEYPKIKQVHEEVTG